MENKIFTVAIDGPVGSGKGTLSLELARQLNAVYLYTGGMYRALALACLRKNIDLQNEEQVLGLLRELPINVSMTDSGVRVFLGVEDVTEEIFLPEVAKAVPITSAIASVREEMVKRQKEMISGKRAVVEGRDIATVVAPNAELKVYLTADVEVRAKRRFAQFQEKGIEKSFEEVLEDTRERDKLDTEREASPLTQTSEAFVIDTTKDTIEDTVEKVKTKLQEKGLL